MTGFNATTAFLLPHPGGLRPRPDASFNATTAFLLLAWPLCGIPVLPRVSMPPRRFCFSRGRGRSSVFVPRFNATTAFLLRTFTCSWDTTPPAFQCHHGVSASQKDFFQKDALLVFQCHHGVSASVLLRDRRPGRDRVSMPPRRFCFWLWALRIFRQARVSMPPRRFCFLSLFARSYPLTRGFNATTAFLLRPSSWAGPSWTG